MSATSEDEQVTAIAALLREAKVEHGRYEAEVLRGLDPDWSRWYADYLLANGLPQILEGSPALPTVTGDLKALLLEADRLYPIDVVGDEWPTYYAKRFVSLASESEK